MNKDETNFNGIDPQFDGRCYAGNGAEKHCQRECERKQELQDDKRAKWAGKPQMYGAHRARRLCDRI